MDFECQVEVKLDSNWIQQVGLVIKVRWIQTKADLDLFRLVYGQSKL